MRKLLATAFLAVVALVLVGCGGNGIESTITDPGHTGTFTIE